MKKRKITISLEDALIAEIDKIVFKKRQKEEQALVQTSRSQVIEELIRLGKEEYTSQYNRR